ncbi:MAG: Ig-like domain-containing protein [Clostridia bacterium]|nr:Ig-like domain-containing protein [Clostridia bacterium]
MKKKLLVIILMVLSLCMFAACDGCNGGSGRQEGEIKVTPAVVTLVEGESVKLSVETELKGTPVWDTSDRMVANVLADGTVRATGVGKAIISASIDENVGSAEITVVAKPDTGEKVTELNVNIPAVSLYVNQSVTATANVTVNGEQTQANITFVSSNDAIATVNNGVITAKGLGSATITVTAVVGSDTYTKTILVTVRENVVVTLSKVKLDMVTLTASDGELSSETLTASVKVNGEAVANPEITWSISEDSATDVITLVNGAVTVKKAGDTIVKASYDYNGNTYSALAAVKVNRFKETIALEGLNRYFERSANEAVANAVITLPAGFAVTGEYTFTDSLGGKINATVESGTLTVDKTALTLGAQNYTITDDLKERTFEIYATDYIIENANDFNALIQPKNEEDVIASAVLVNDIDLGSAEYIYKINKAGRTLDFEGNGHVIKGGKTNGIFGTVTGGNIRNVVLLGTEIVSSDRSGAFANTIGNGARVENIAVINPNITGTNVAMFAGRVYSVDTTVMNCIAVDNRPYNQAEKYVISGIFDILGTSAQAGYFSNLLTLTPFQKYGAPEGDSAIREIQATPTTGGSNYKIKANSWEELIEKVGNNSIEQIGVIELIGGKPYIAGILIDFKYEEIIRTGENADRPLVVGSENVVSSTALNGKTVETITVYSGVHTKTIESSEFTVNGANVTLSATALEGLYGQDNSVIMFNTTDGSYFLKVSIVKGISSYADYADMMANGRDGNYVQTADIDMTGKKYSVNQNTFFTGTYDGQGYKIIGGTTNGWFANVAGGTVKNLILVGTNIIMNSRGGSIANTLQQGGLLDNIYVVNAKAATISGNEYIGLLVGRTYTSTTSITNCLVVDAELPVSGSVSSIVGVIGDSTEQNVTVKVTDGETETDYVYNTIFDYKDENGAEKAGRISNVYSISLNGYIAMGDEVRSGSTVTGIIERIPDDIKSVGNVESFAEFISAAGDRVSAFKYVNANKANEIKGATDAITFKIISTVEVEQDTIPGFTKSEVNTITATEFNGITITGVSLLATDGSTTDISGYSLSGTTITFNAPAFANVTGGSGISLVVATETTRYIAKIDIVDGYIATAEDFKAMMASSVTAPLTGYYVQTADIDLEDWASGYVVNTINFKGVYDGQGYSILNGRTAGLFGTIAGAGTIVKNLVLVNTTLYQIISDRVGALASTVQEGAVIDNVYVIGAKFDTARSYTNATNSSYVNTDNQREGLLVGNTYTDGTVIKNCLVVDTQTTAPQYTYAVVGHRGATGMIVSNTYAISTNYTVSCGSNRLTSEVICADYTAFSNSAEDLAKFTYLNIDNNGNVTVGRGTTKTTIYTAPIGE